MVFIRGGRLCLASLTVVGTLASAAVLAAQGVADAQGSGGTLYVSRTGRTPARVSSRTATMCHDRLRHHTGESGLDDRRRSGELSASSSS